MAITSDLNNIKVFGDFTSDDCFNLLAAMHNTVVLKGFTDFSIDFSRCTRAHMSEMVMICSACRHYWHDNIDIKLSLPTDDKLNRVFINTNWAHIIDFRSYDESRFRGYTHAPAIIFRDETEQSKAVDKILDILLAAIKHFRREELRYIEWAVNELTDNVINHSNSPVGGIVQLTNHQQKKQIEIGICDSGIGIPNSLRSGESFSGSDTEALEKSIKEGVTRDKNYGQGNGLYGSWRISEKTNGTFSIRSGKASLISNHIGLQISHGNIPYNGTSVVSRIGYKDTFDLSEALVFSGRKHIPVDYVETHFDSDKFGNITLILKEESQGFGSRKAGEPVRRKIENLVGFDGVNKIIVNFSEILLISSSYADEVFGKLFKELGPIRFMQEIELINVDPLVRNLIDRAISQRMQAN